MTGPKTTAGKGVFQMAEVVADILRSYKTYREDYITAVLRGIAAADAGDVIDHDEFFESWYRDSPDRPSDPTAR